MGRTRPKALIPLALAVWLAFPVPGTAGEAAEVEAVRRLLRDDDPRRRAAAVRRLAGRESQAALDLLVSGLADPHPYVRRAAAGALSALVQEGPRGRLAARVRRHKDATARLEALRTFATWGQGTGHGALVDALADASGEVRAEAVRWLGTEARERSRDLIRARLGDADGLVRAEAVDALGRGGLRTEEQARLRADPDARVRLSALESSAAAGSPPGDAEAAVVAVRHGLDDAVWSVRLVAAELAGRIPDARVVDALIPCLEDLRPRVREAAHAALVRISGIPFEADPARWRAWLDERPAVLESGADPAREGARPSPPPDPGSRTVARFLDVPLTSGHVTFVLDASGSMREPLPGGGTRWSEVVAELERALETLGAAHVNVLCFADGVRGAFPSVERLTPGRRRRLGRWLANQAPGGRTALYDGLAVALSDPEVDTIVLLSDGAPSAGAFFTKTDLLEEVRRANRWRRARIDVVAVGTDGVARRWRDVLRRLAEESGGSYRAR